ncbi:unnamed protein product [Parascedosporium putredinis]|uniref:Uncharacterized protein n=1 Tax=Parascedosporium putredinis TaxID=1442378 RepID=A0A9P1GZL1_9PEZI|nr:unnamed protein product [Parascedosporium putredinis]CAI7990878.1 unnamed protein product [Parascedosporium putredinis]
MEPQMETGSHLPERIDPLTPGQEGLPAGSNIDTDIKMEDVSDAGATRPPAPPSRYECEGARLDGNCKHLEDLKRHIENGQVLQLQLDRVTDSDLDKWASQLRTAIRDFAIRYFESDSPFLNFQERFKMAQRAAGFELMAETTVGTVDFRSFLSSPTRCSAVIQACIWAFLDREVFSKFCWAGELSDDVVRIYEKLWNAAEDVEGDRKVKAWVVSTTKLFVDLDGIEGEKEAMKEERNATIQNLVENILKIIEPFAKLIIGRIAMSISSGKWKTSWKEQSPWTAIFAVRPLMLPGALALMSLISSMLRPWR